MRVRLPAPIEPHHIMGLVQHLPALAERVWCGRRLRPAVTAGWGHADQLQAAAKHSLAEGTMRHVTHHPPRV